MDKIDIFSLMAWSLGLAALDFTGAQIVLAQCAWLGVAWIGRRLLDRWVGSAAIEAQPVG
jgi:hypothetical protein